MRLALTLFFIDRAPAVRFDALRRPDFKGFRPAHAYGQMAASA